MWESAVLSRRVRQSDASEHFDDTIARVCCRTDVMLQQNALQLGANGYKRIQRLHRILKHDRNSRSAQLIQRLVVRTKQLLPVEANAAPHRCRRRQQTEDRKCSLRLARAGFADEANRLTFLNRESDIRNRLRVAIANTQFVDGEQAHFSSLASNASRIASPKKLKHSRITASSAAGISSIHDAPSI